MVYIAYIIYILYFIYNICLVKGGGVIKVSFKAPCTSNKPVILLFWYEKHNTSQMISLYKLSSSLWHLVGLLKFYLLRESAPFSLWNVQIQQLLQHLQNQTHLFSLFLTWQQLPAAIASLNFNLTFNLAGNVLPHLLFVLSPLPFTSK